MIYALKNELIDAAVVSTTTPEKPLYPVAKLVFSPEEVLECKGSRYTYAPNLLALREAYELGVKRLAIVGVPYQINGLRYLQHSTPDIEVAKLYERHVVFSIGVFCSEVFTYNGLMKYFEEIGVNPSTVEKLNIKGKVFIKTKDGELVKPLPQLHKYERPACLFCRDYSAELADISVGGLATEGWTITVIRTNAGNNIFQGAIKKGMLTANEIRLESKQLKLLKKPCDKKRMRPLPMIKTFFSP